MKIQMTVLNSCSSKGLTIKYVTLFLANFNPPLPCHTLSHIPGRPPKSTSHISQPPMFRGDYGYNSKYNHCYKCLKCIRNSGVTTPGQLRAVHRDEFISARVEPVLKMSSVSYAYLH